jgi:hypothetical protein
MQISLGNVNDSTGCEAIIEFLSIGVAPRTASPAPFVVRPAVHSRHRDFSKKLHFDVDF